MTGKKDDEFYDTLVGITIGILTWLIKIIFSIVWAALAIPIVLIVKRAQTSPEDRLRSLNQSATWGNEIESVICQHCTTPNEPTTGFCYFCGAYLENPPTRQNENPDDRNLPWLALLLLGCFIFLVLLLIITAYSAHSTYVY